MRLAIIISTFNRPTSLSRLLNSLLPQLNPSKHQVIVAENGTPSPMPINLPIPGLIHLHDARPGKSRIQNRAIARANADILVFLDDDVVASRHYLEAVEEFFINYPEYAAMKGRVLPEEDPARKLGELAFYLELPIVDHGERVLPVRGVVGANMAFRAQVLAMLGGFDERLGPGAAGDEEETELSKRLRSAGFQIGYAPRALVYHEVDPARANRETYLNLAWRRGYSRTLHESHRLAKVITLYSVAMLRLAIAKAFCAPLRRVAREERRVATARGMLDGLIAQRRSRNFGTLKSSTKSA